MALNPGSCDFSTTAMPEGRTGCERSPDGLQSVQIRRCYKGGMSAHTLAPDALSDSQLLVEVRRLVGTERQATARLIVALGELDARRLYLGEGCSSLFTCCTQVLHLSEHAAYGRIEAARAARKWPVVQELLAGVAAPDSSRSPGPTSHRREPSGAACGGPAQDEARGSGDHRGAAAAARRSLDLSQAAGAAAPHAAAIASREYPDARNAIARCAGRGADGSTCADAGKPPRGAAARAGTVQGAVHDNARDARAASRGAGPAAPPDPRRRHRRSLRVRPRVGSSKSCAGLVTLPWSGHARHGRRRRRLAMSRRP